jgi:hypothetical protein
MTGADIIGALLLAEVGPVAAPNIRAGQLPATVTLPAILFRVVSTVERQPLIRGPKVRTVDRVAVTCRANTYDEQRAVMDWIKRRCAGFVGSFGDAANVSVLTAGTGPELDGPGNSFERTADFRVSFDA